MWAKFKTTSKIRKDGKEVEDGRKNLNVNEEYVSALRTQSYADIFAKAQTLVTESSSSPSPSPSLCHKKFSEFLLEPGQESIPAILESSPIFSRIPELKILMLNYFELSAEASRICSHLLKNLNKIQSSYDLIQRVIDSTIDHDHDHVYYSKMISEMNSFIIQSNPFSTPNKHDFELINDRYSFVLHHLKSNRKRIARKMKLITCINKASGVCITAACGLISIAAIIIAAHTLSALVMGPAIFSFPLKCLKKKLNKFRFMKSGFLRKIGQQLDAAAKGTYILNRDFDTMSRLVARVHDEVEHNKAMIQFCLDRREEDDKFSQQVVKELKKNNVGFRKQVEELEEHVYLCFLTINRARVLVIKELANSSLESLR